MVVDLGTKEIDSIIGAKHIGCHVIAPVKKGMEVGGMVMCLTLERRTNTLPYYIPDENVRKAVMKGTCGLMVGISIEMASHLTESIIGVQC